MSRGLRTVLWILGVLALIWTLVAVTQLPGMMDGDMRMDGSSMMWVMLMVAVTWSVMLILDGVFVYLVVRALRSPAMRRVREDAGRTLEPVRDPVCGELVHPAAAAGEATYQGRTYYFASTECLRRFEAEPARFVGREPTSIGKSAVDAVEFERHEPPYTTEGNFTAPKFGAAGSGGLEYERLPERHTAAEDDTGEVKKREHG